MAMDVAAAITIGKKVYKVADKIIKYVKADNEACFGLDEEVSVVLMGDDVGLVAGHFIEDAYTTKDGSLSIKPEWSNGWLIRLTAHPFPAESRLWNGPDLIKNNKYRSMLASLFHDLIWEHGDELAKAWGVSKQDVLRWGDGVLYALWMYASAHSLRGRVEARLAWSVCEFSKGWYHSLKKLLGLHSILFALLLLAGCGTPPDWQVVDISGTNAVLRAMGGGAAVAAANDQQITQVVDEMDFNLLDWCWGGANGEKAKLVDGVVIGSLKVSSNDMSYKWIAGGCEKLGAKDRSDAGETICALFAHIDGRWRGGKFDWISTSRKSRSLENIKGGYGGWDPKALSATEFALVICSQDGKRRSNVTVFSK